MSNFSFSYSVFRRLVLQTRKNQGLFGKGLRSWMSSIMGEIEAEQELFALEFGKIAEYEFVYSLSSTNIDQSAPNFVEVYMTIRSRMGFIIELIGPVLSELSTLELQNLPYLTLFAL